MTKIKAPWLSDPAAQAVFSALLDAGHSTFAVGGCVRNTLFGVPVSDVDIATNALPHKVIEIANSAGMNPIPTGIEHGTITVISNGISFEVTTFRKDLETDGRRAVVSFSDKIDDDARRRDFTMNALYCTFDGEIIDPLGGMDDVLNRRLRFIGTPEHRIQEDFLRILRFFRFFAQYCDPLNGIDAEGLAACAANIEGIETLSKERIGAEMRKLLAAVDPAPALASMAKIGALAQILPGANPQFVAPLVALEQAHAIEPKWQRRLAVIGHAGATKALRLSRAEQKYLAGLPADLPFPESGYRLGASRAIDNALILAAMSGDLLPKDFRHQINLGAAAIFPVKAVDLMEKIPAGPPLGAELRRLEMLWIKNGFKLDKFDRL